MGSRNLKYRKKAAKMQPKDTLKIGSLISQKKIKANLCLLVYRTETPEEKEIIRSVFNGAWNYLRSHLQKN